jgi:putative membrane protein
MPDETIRQTAEQDADPRVDLAVQRTELAEDRTLLAWIRTSMALMGTGVAFDKGVQYFHESRLATGTAFVQSGHFMGLSFTLISTLLLVFVLWQHLRTLSVLARIKGVKAPRFPVTAFASVLVIFLGVAILVVLVISN